MSRLERLLYFGKYTAASYLDALATIPVWTAEKIAQGSERLLGDKTPAFLSLDYTHKHSPVYQGRERLRDSLDTRPGVLFLQSNVIGAIPFVVAGMPAAELAQELIDTYLSQAPEIIQYATNSLITLGVQMATGYTTFMANEVRVNREKYTNDNNRLSIRKIGSGVAKAVKAFLTFDLSYITGKTAGQSALLAAGKDPWKASGFFDALAIPLWYTLSIPLGLRSGVIETEQTKAWDEQDSESDTAGEPIDDTLPSEDSAEDVSELKPESA
jgi:hypothetical protein